MNWRIEYGRKPMSKKPNRQVKLQFFRTRYGNWCKETGKYIPYETPQWAVRIDIADHAKGYTFLDQSNHSIKFPSIEKAKEYADSVIQEVLGFLDKEGVEC